MNVSRQAFEMVQEPCEFWAVWTKSGHKPRFNHHTEESALAEAQRLALLCPGAKFIVFKAYTKLHAVLTPQEMEPSL